MFNIKFLEMKTYLKQKRRKRNLLIAGIIYLVIMGCAIVAICTIGGNEVVHTGAIVMEYVLIVPALYFIFKR